MLDRDVLVLNVSCLRHGETDTEAVYSPYYRVNFFGTGSATSKGFDLSTRMALTSSLSATLRPRTVGLAATYKL